MTSVRPYKRAWTNEEALALLSEQSGIKFDADFVAALVENQPPSPKFRRNSARRYTTRVHT